MPNDDIIIEIVEQPLILEIVEEQIIIEMWSGEQWPPGAWSWSYVHNQAIAASEWTITHSLWYRPSYNAIDSAWDEIVWIPSRPDADTMVLTFSAATWWTAYLS